MKSALVNHFSCQNLTLRGWQVENEAASADKINNNLKKSLNEEIF